MELGEIFVKCERHIHKIINFFGLLYIYIYVHKVKPGENMNTNIIHVT